MPCTRCQQEFSLFSRSHGCSSCNYVFCNKCSNHWVKSGGEKKRVCESCHRKLTTTATSANQHAPVALLQDAPPTYTETGDGGRGLDIAPGSTGGDLSNSALVVPGGKSPAIGRSALTPDQVKTIQNLPPSQRQAAGARLLAANSGAPQRKSPSPSPGIDKRALQHLPPSQRKAAESRAESATRTGSDPQDAVLAERLAGLRQKPDNTETGNKEGSTADSKGKSGSDGDSNTQDDMAADDLEGRLARLKGVDRNTLAQTSEKMSWHQPKMTAFEEVDLLLRQTHDEVNLDSHLLTQDETLQARLDKLKGQTAADSAKSKQSGGSSNPSDDLLCNVAGSHGVAPPNQAQSGITLGEEANALLDAMMAQSQEEQAAAAAALAADAELVARAAELRRTADEETSSASAGASASSEATAVVSATGNSDLDAQVAKALAMQDMYANMSDDDVDEDNEETAGVNKLLEKIVHEAMLDDELEKTGLSDVVRKQEQKDAKPMASSSVNVAAQSGNGATNTVPSPSAGTIPAPLTANEVASYYDPHRVDGELPWCCICNSNAIIRCLDCDSDLYCKRCYVDGHREFGMHDHQVVKFVPPPKLDS